MTVLAEYQRLEAEAIWRPAPEEQRRDVIVGIGKATLTISASNGTALSHWSLPAVERLNPGQTPAVYAPGNDTPERLEVADEEMTVAIERVLDAIKAGPGKRSTYQNIIVAACVLALFAGAIAWLPGALSRYTASLVPEAARGDIGARLREQVVRLTGQGCSDPAGDRALRALEARLFPGTDMQLLVVPSALTETAHLPGGTILIGHRLVEDHETPEVLAGYLLAEDLRRQAADPLEAVLENAGFTAAFRLLTTGRIDDMALGRHAEILVATAPTPVSDQALIAQFSARRISGAPYAYAVDFSGETTMPFIDASQDMETAQPLLGDGEWIALQRICED